MWVAAVAGPSFGVSGSRAAAASPAVSPEAVPDTGLAHRNRGLVSKPTVVAQLAVAQPAATILAIAVPTFIVVPMRPAATILAIVSPISAAAVATN